MPASLRRYPGRSPINGRMPVPSFLISTCRPSRTTIGRTIYRPPIPTGTSLRGPRASSRRPVGTIGQTRRPRRRRSSLNRLRCRKRSDSRARRISCRRASCRNRLRSVSLYPQAAITCRQSLLKSAKRARGKTAKKDRSLKNQARAQAAPSCRGATGNGKRRAHEGVLGAVTPPTQAA